VYESFYIILTTQGRLYIQELTLNTVHNIIQLTKIRQNKVTVVQQLCNSSPNYNTPTGARIRIVQELDGGVEICEHLVARSPRIWVLALRFDRPRH